MILDAEGEVLLNARSGMVVRGVAVMAALAARAMLRENILIVVRMTQGEDVVGIRRQSCSQRPSERKLLETSDAVPR